MKEILIVVLNSILVIATITGFGLIAGFAIAQLVIVWNWLLGGNRK